MTELLQDDDHGCQRTFLFHSNTNTNETGNICWQTDAEKRPFYQDNKWWLPVENGFIIPGVLTSAPKKKDRVVLEFCLLDGKRKKFYCCQFCSVESNRTEWIFHKNYVHQHIPRRHQNQCCFCNYCRQYIFREIFDTHQKTCHKRSLCTIATRHQTNTNNKQTNFLSDYNNNNHQTNEQSHEEEVHHHQFSHRIGSLNNSFCQNNVLFSQGQLKHQEATTLSTIGHINIYDKNSQAVIISSSSSSSSSSSTSSGNHDTSSSSIIPHTHLEVTCLKKNNTTRTSSSSSPALESLLNSNYYNFLKKDQNLLCLQKHYNQQEKLSPTNKPNVILKNKSCYCYCNNNHHSHTYE